MTKLVGFFKKVSVIFLMSQIAFVTPTKESHDVDDQGLDKHGTTISAQIEAMFRSHSYELSIKPNNQGRPKNSIVRQETQTVKSFIIYGKESIRTTFRLTIDQLRHLTDPALNSYCSTNLFTLFICTRGKPVAIDLSLIIESISDISEKNMDITFTLCVHESWKDDRLTFVSNGDDESIVLPRRLAEKLWVPDLFIVGSKNSFIHQTLVDNVIMRLHSNGMIHYSLKITTTVACQMNLRYFPLDTELCYLAFQSLGYNSREVTLNWSVGNLTEELFMDAGLIENMPKFRLVHYAYEEDKSNSVESHVNASDYKSQLRMKFELERYFLSVFFQSYFPAMIMVILAGLGMWLDPKSVPARVAMGITSVLTISTIITGLKAALPKVSYLTAMDIYLWTCFLFVFSTVVEYCILNFRMTQQIDDEQECLESTAKQQMGQSNRKDDQDDILETIYFDNAKGYRFERINISEEIAMVIRTRNFVKSQRHSNIMKQRTDSQKEYQSKKMNSSIPFIHSLRYMLLLRHKEICFEVIFRIAYLGAFLAFNIFYWIYYVILTEHKLEKKLD